MKAAAGCQERLRARDRYESFHPRVCGRKVQPGTEFCVLHSEEAKAKRRAASEAKWNAEVAYSRWLHDMRAALERIANEALNEDPPQLLCPHTAAAIEAYRKLQRAAPPAPRPSR